jgi:hypothetical protein
VLARELELRVHDRIRRRLRVGPWPGPADIAAAAAAASESAMQCSSFADFTRLLTSTLLNFPVGGGKKKLTCTSIVPFSMADTKQASLIEQLAFWKANPICAHHTLLFKLRGQDLPVKDGYMQGTLHYFLLAECS